MPQKTQLQVFRRHRLHPSLHQSNPIHSLAPCFRVSSIVEAMSWRLVPVVSGSQRLHHLLSVSSFPRNTLCVIRPKASAPALVRGGPSTKRFLRTRGGNGSPRPGLGPSMISRAHATVPPSP